MKTAVEFVFEELNKWRIENFGQEALIGIPQEVFDRAKEMEKEQIEDFFNAGVRYGSGSVMSTEWGEDTEEYNFEQYYNETFKSE
jgi:hypothetical protein